MFIIPRTILNVYFQAAFILNMPKSRPFNGYIIIHRKDIHSSFHFVQINPKLHLIQADQTIVIGKLRKNEQVPILTR